MSSEEDVEKAFETLKKAGLIEEADPDPEPNTVTDPPEDDPPEEEPSLPPLEEWISDYEVGVDARKHKWKRRLTGKGALVLKRSIESEPKWKNKTKKAIENEARAAALKKVSPDEYNKAIEDTRPETYSEAAIRKSYKLKKRIGIIYSVWDYMKKRLAKMPTGTTEEREAKLLAAKRCMEVLGELRKGLISETEAKGKIDEFTRVTRR